MTCSSDSIALTCDTASGYVLDGADCALCNATHTNWATCDVSGALSCVDSYYVTANDCSLCSTILTGSVNCANASYALTCSVGKFAF